MESSSRAAQLQNAIGTTICGNTQVINAGRDVVFHGSPALPPTGLSDLLRPVSNATHTRVGYVARCDPGTRLEVIAQIKQWLNGSDKRTAICWLSGPAGYGKSALAQTSVAAAPAQSQLKRGAEPILAEAKSDCWVVTPTSRLIPALAQKPA
ncbi:hypothetical protein K443DRAFT_2097 [Laccaria amethystina LaAM-08-1]|uniref:Nephrocystin 3-like N-terminal domain-containing protein n=1 Tax=Laccaria amethystina LaAM-08-1 TaxID=1095629 RepID=A0A0C9X6R2_9AGAR|nr:hypothetical protein K443DRAFT_2097 [Laccaria amethystina LaAM-08-1]